MTNILVYGADGSVVRTLDINDDLVYVSGRVHKGKKGYYKGLGVPYDRHFVFDVVDPDQYSHVKKSDVFYIGNEVSKKCFENKTGIFQERYQPFFPDFIGSCGVKEGTIVLNSSIFERSSVEVLDYVLYDEENTQSYYLLDYKCDRKSYLYHDGDPIALRELLDHMLQNDWNFLWDKGSINDVSADGRVSDVADLFISNDLSHKLGTVYSILYSLEKFSTEKFQSFLNVCNLTHVDSRSFIFNSIKILEKNNIDVSSMMTERTLNKLYKSIVLNFLVMGKNCAYCACNLYQDNGDKVTNQYVDMVSDQLKHI